MADRRDGQEIAGCRGFPEIRPTRCRRSPEKARDARRSAPLISAGRAARCKVSAATSSGPARSPRRGVLPTVSRQPRADQRHIPHRPACEDLAQLLAARAANSPAPRSRKASASITRISGFSKVFDLVDSDPPARPGGCSEVVAPAGRCAPRRQRTRRRPDWR